MKYSLSYDYYSRCLIIFHNVLTVMSSVEIKRNMKNMLRIKKSLFIFRKTYNTKHSYISTQTGFPFPFCSIFTFPQNRQHTTNKCIFNAMPSSVGKVTWNGCVLPFYIVLHEDSICLHFSSLDLFFSKKNWKNRKKISYSQKHWNIN